MAKNYWTWFKGQIGIQRRGRLSDANGRVDLDQFDSVHLLVAKNPSTDPVIDMATCDRDADQSSEASETEGKGWFTYETDADAAEVAAGLYQMSIVCMEGQTRHYFPLNKDSTRTYGKLQIHNPLS